eukprot:4121258-Alexandrium_andersonii.AAC.1
MTSSNVNARAGPMYTAIGHAPCRALYTIAAALLRPSHWQPPSRLGGRQLQQVKPGVSYAS